jgi:ATP-dependent DNA ligase
MTKFQKREGIMLAYPAEEKRIKAFPLLEIEDGSKQRSFFHQPKLNGERARTEWFDNVPYLISSYGNEFKFLSIIQRQLETLTKYLEKGNILYDGEVYVHGWSREEVDSALRRQTNKSNETQFLQYHIFDIQNTDPQYARLHLLGTIEQAVEHLELENIKVVPYGVCTEIDWLSHCSSYCEEGYEGIILRSPFSSYEMKRIPGLLKFKPTEADLYEIVAVNEAVSQEGELKGMVGSFTVKAKDEPGDHCTFDVGAGKLKHSQRIQYWQWKDKCIGQMLLVKHELLRTTNQVPIAAVTVDVVW